MVDAIRAHGLFVVALVADGLDAVAAEDWFRLQEIPACVTSDETGDKRGMLWFISLHSCFPFHL